MGNRLEPDLTLRTEEPCNEATARASKIVVEIRPNVLVEPDGSIALHTLKSVARSVAGLMRRGSQVLIVPSGTVKFGSTQLKLSPLMISLCEEFGTGLLLALYLEVYGRRRIGGSQVKITSEDFTDQRHKDRLHKTLHRLLEMSSVPIIRGTRALMDSSDYKPREPSISKEHALAIDIARLTQADLLIVLTDVGCPADALMAKPATLSEDSRPNFGHPPRTDRPLFVAAHPGFTNVIGRIVAGEAVKQAFIQEQPQTGLDF